MTSLRICATFSFSRMTRSVSSANSPLLVELVGVVDLGSDAHLGDGVEEGMDEVMAIGFVTSITGAGYLAQWLAYLLVVALGKERIALAQRVIVIDQVDQFDIGRPGRRPP